MSNCQGYLIVMLGHRIGFKYDVLCLNKRMSFDVSLTLIVWLWINFGRQLSDQDFFNISLQDWVWS